MTKTEVCGDCYGIGEIRRTHDGVERRSVCRVCGGTGYLRVLLEFFVKSSAQAGRQ